MPLESKWADSETITARNKPRRDAQTKEHTRTKAGARKSKSEQKNGRPRPESAKGDKKHATKSEGRERHGDMPAGGSGARSMVENSQKPKVSAIDAEKRAILQKKIDEQRKILHKNRQQQLVNDFLNGDDFAWSAEDEEDALLQRLK